MNCKKCGDPLDDAKINAAIAAHDDSLIDILVTCNSCGAVLNTFVSLGSCELLNN